MRFQFIISTQANRFFFVSNLSQWHFSSRVSYNRSWRNSITFPPNTKQTLQNFNRIIANYSFDSPRQFLGIPFFSLPETHVWSQVKNLVKAKEYKKLQSVFRKIEPCFQKIWIREKPKLKVMQKLLTSASKSNSVKSCLRVLLRLCGKKPNDFSTKIPVFLLLSADKGYGGTMLKGKKELITLECSSYPPNRAVDLLPMLLHETMHLICEQSMYQSILVKFLQKKEKIIRSFKFYDLIPDSYSLLNEVIISSFIPEGYLSKKYFGVDVKTRARQRLFYSNASATQIFSSLRYFCAAKLFSLAQKYVENKKQIDSCYLHKTLLTIKKFDEEIYKKYIKKR